MPIARWKNPFWADSTNALSSADWRKILLGVAVGIAITEVAGYVAIKLFGNHGKKKRSQERSLQTRAHSAGHQRQHDKYGNTNNDKEQSTGRNAQIADGVAGLIGNTPLVRLNALSAETGCEILAKAEYLNPGGSPKDRVALYIIRQAEKEGLLGPPQTSNDAIAADGDGSQSSLPLIRRSTVFEGTVGSTGISLAMISRALGYACHIVVPDDQAQEKYALLERHGATVERVRPASIVDKRQFVNTARHRAQEFDAKAKASANQHHLPKDKRARGFFADQFENLANFRAHYETTGPEIWQQTNGCIDAFVAGAGTGGTIAGVAHYLKQHNEHIHITLVDPAGSGLYHKVRHGVFFSPYEAEGKRRRHQVDTVVEGVGINRLTRNFALALPELQRAAFRDVLTSHPMLDDVAIDSPYRSTNDNDSDSTTTTTHDNTMTGDHGWINSAMRVTDEEAVAMSRFLVDREGIFVGSSSAVNCVGAVRLARQLGPGHTIVTLLCDSGQRHLTKFWSDSYLEKANVPVTIAKNLDFIK
ncbi:tryptophan synthase beta subunit-like PLP-dependent enzyme [Syncephalis fuscata]|nr:tryptophan synthase beta subunit-like PLP-dependent enzyme [Syncephalis fuscata]